MASKSKYTAEEIVNKFRNIHGNEFEYNMDEFIDTSSKIGVICAKHGEFTQAVRHHLSGQKCFKCRSESKMNTVDYVLKLFEATHGDTYNYDSVKFKGMLSKISIQCKVHGKFSQTPHDHYHGRGCPACGLDRVRLDFTEILQRCTEAYGTAYDYTSAYRDGDNLMNIRCPIHGHFSALIANHTRGHGCRKCAIAQCGVAKTADVEDRIAAAKVKHNNLYSYELSTEGRCKFKTPITCKLHGTFYQTWSNHLNGQGCPRCKQGGRYTENYFLMYPERKNINATLYLIKLIGDTVPFYKIGISKNIKDRFRQLPYEVVPVLLKTGTLYDVYMKEQHFLKNYGYRNRYVPSIKFGGDKECFILPETEIIQLLEA